MKLPKLSNPLRKIPFVRNLLGKTKKEQVAHNQKLVELYNKGKYLRVDDKDIDNKELLKNA
jgi:spore coat protein CotF